MGTPAPTPQPPGYLALANDAAGSVRQRALADVAGVLAQQGPTELVLTAGPDDVDAALRSLQGRRPVVVGGDGSLHLVVNRLRSLGLGDIPLGLVPLGTGNDLARGLELSLEPADAARVAATGRSLAMPVATGPALDDVVVNNAHVGVGERAAQVAAGLKARLGALAYPMGALAAGVRPAIDRVEVRVDDREVYRGDALAVVVTLGPSAGGGHRIAPDADPADPNLEVVLLEGGTARSRLAVGATMAVGRDPRTRPEVHRWTGRRVMVAHPERADAGWDVDGELLRWTSPVELAVETAAWHLVV